LKFHVKWEGYDSKKDMTWEPEDNLRWVARGSKLGICGVELTFVSENRPQTF
jgi:hypothetical protein